jgi:hypothetical protein
MSHFKNEDEKIPRLHIAFLVLGLLASPLIYKAWVEHEAKAKKIIQRETGLALPSKIEVQDAQVQLFSLADGVNYDWLLSGSTSLVPWARSVGHNEIQHGVAWGQITSFQVICPFRNPAFEQIGLHSVWRIVNTLPDKEATSYLYIAEDEETGLLSTFNP